MLEVLVLKEDHYLLTEAGKFTSRMGFFRSSHGKEEFFGRYGVRSDHDSRVQHYAEDSIEVCWLLLFAQVFRWNY